MMASVTVAAATNLLRQAYGSYAKDRTLVVPMSNPSDFRLMTKPQLKAEFCTDKPKVLLPRLSDFWEREERARLGPRSAESEAWMRENTKPSTGPKQTRAQREEVVRTGNFPPSVKKHMMEFIRQEELREQKPRPKPRRRKTNLERIIERRV